MNRRGLFGLLAGAFCAPLAFAKRNKAAGKAMGTVSEVDGYMRILNTSKSHTLTIGEYTLRPGDTLNIQPGYKFR